MNSYQKKIGIGIVTLLFLSVLIVPVIAEQPSYADPDLSSISLRHVMLGDFLSEPGHLEPRYTLNVVFLAAEWVMIGILGAFGLWFAGKHDPEKYRLPDPVSEEVPSPEQVEKDRAFTKGAGCVGLAALAIYLVFMVVVAVKWISGTLL